MFSGSNSILGKGAFDGVCRVGRIGRHLVHQRQELARPPHQLEHQLLEEPRVLLLGPVEHPLDQRPDAPVLALEQGQSRVACHLGIGIAQAAFDQP
jgi:hypothetical protein